MRRRLRKTGRSGFTLLEILLVSLAIVLLFSVIAGISLTVMRLGQTQSQHALHQRIVRNVTQIMGDDIRTAIHDLQYQNQRANRGTPGETIRHFGVNGTDKQLRIDLLNYSRMTFSQDEMTQDSSELRTVFYEFFPNAGLVRRERDYLAPVLLGLEEHTQAVSGIIDGRFRYFDGAVWHDHWASLSSKRLPSAIEVLFYIESGGEIFSDRIVIQIPPGLHAHASYRRAEPPRSVELISPPPQYTGSPQPTLSPTPPPASPFLSLFDE